MNDILEALAPMPTRTPFDVLGVPPHADRAVIRAAYRALARKYHPDAGRIPTDRSHKLMVKLNWAMEELQRDLAGWRIRAGVQQPAAAKTYSTVRVQKDEAPDSSTARAKAFDERWRRFMEKYSRNCSRNSSDEPPPSKSW
jgi:curved DNA-binding protein CbpA